MPSIVIHTLQLLLMLAVPMIGFAWLIHRIERLTQRRLAERFGWRSNLWTGWLGTPIHELSHAAMCVVFRHHIDEIALFDPDEQAGRLGYVRHSFRHGNTFEELGNLFIGIAPLIGGLLALWGLLWMFYPDAAWQAVKPSTPHVSVRGALDNISSVDNIGAHRVDGALDSGTVTRQSAGPFDRLLSTTLELCRNVFLPAHLLTGRFWGFLYLALCVGSHMAPSRSDYAGARRGVTIFLMAAVVAAALSSILIRNQPQTVTWLAHLLIPPIALMLLSVILTAIASVAVHVVTSFFPVRYKHV